MFIELSESQIINLEADNIIEFISLWDNKLRAEKYYINLSGVYTGYHSNPDSATATPVRIYKFKNLSFELSKKNTKIP